MTTTALPTLFVSHGSPMLVFEDTPARSFMAGLASTLPRPKAILCVSAHWETDRPAVSGAAKPETIHDFSGFPEALYRLQYPAPGAPELAKRVAELIPNMIIDKGQGLDHGAWNPLMLIYPEADIPVALLSILLAAGPAAHVALGRKLAPLREGVLILATGGAVHNLASSRSTAGRPPIGPSLRRLAGRAHRRRRCRGVGGLQASAAGGGASRPSAGGAFPAAVRGARRRSGRIFEGQGPRAPPQLRPWQPQHGCLCLGMIGGQSAQADRRPISLAYADWVWIPRVEKIFRSSPGAYIAHDVAAADELALT